MIKILNLLSLIFLLYLSFLNPFTYVRLVKSFLMVDKQKEAFDQTVKLKSDYFEYMKQLNEGRDPWAEDAPDMKDFNQVLKHWGIKPIQIEDMKKYYMSQMIIFSILGLMGATIIGFADRIVYELQGMILILLGLAVVPVFYWRYQIYSHKKFVFLKDWYLWGAFSWIGKETPFHYYERMKKEKKL